MSRKYAYLFAAFATVLALGGPAQGAARFEAADVHVSPQSSRNEFRRGPLIREGRYEIRFATMVDLISAAYGIEAEKVVGGPNWLESDLFDVIAKAPARISIEAARPMLQALLADRFNLAFHRDTRPMPVYALRTSARLKLKQAEGSDPGSAPGRCRFMPSPPPAPVQPAAPPPFAWSCRNVTMPELANQLRTGIFMADQYLGDRIVVDETHLNGAMGFRFRIHAKRCARSDHSVRSA